MLGLIILFYPENIYAHTLKTAIGSESSGFIVGPQHPAKKNFVYYFKGASFSTMTATRCGASKWRGLYLVTIEETTSIVSQNYVTDYYDKSTSTIAYNRYTYNTNTNVISKFSLNFNTYFMDQYSQVRKNQIAMHEWGHTFGLKDLYDDNNSDKAMYGYGNIMTATSVTKKDYPGMYYGLH